MKLQITTLLITCLLGLNASAGVMNVEKLNAELSQKNATWVAKDNALNQLSASDVKHMMGLKNPPSGVIEFNVAGKRALTTLPAVLDWRNKDGKNWVSPILDQGNCGSCVAFASIGAMETQLNIDSLFAVRNTRLSPQNLFACGGGACEMGWEPEMAASFLVSSGVTDEACMPYTSGATGQDVACTAACPDANSRTYRLANYATPNQGANDIDAVKAALQKGPLVTTLTVFADFITYSSGVYLHASGDALGGHAVSIVGYDDATQSFIIRNSWGADWGEQGFAHVSYQDISGIGQQTWSFQAPATSGAVSLQNPRDRSFLSGDTVINAISSYVGSAVVTVSIYDQQNKAVWSDSCQQGDCKLTLPTAKFSDGRYEAQAIAFDKNGQKIDSSDREYFYIANNKPNLSLSFAGDQGLQLSKPLSDRVVFAVSAKSSTVPYSSITFHSKAADGTEATRTANIVTDGMTMGWRTNMVANGTYEIWFEGHLKTSTADYSVESSHQKVVVQN